ncbi:MAG: Spy/CpxP family protein refolding chaperone [PVC group bacterium]
MKRKTMAMALIGLTVAGGAIPTVQAREAGDVSLAPAARIGQLLMELELSNGQKKEIAEVITRNRDGNRELIRGIISARRDLAGAIHGSDFDEISVRTSARVVGNLAEEMTVRRARQSTEIRSVLTEQQRELLREAGEKIFEKIEERLEQAGLAVDFWAARQTEL